MNNFSRRSINLSTQDFLCKEKPSGAAPVDVFRA